MISTIEKISSLSENPGWRSGRVMGCDEDTQVPSTTRLGAIIRLPCINAYAPARTRRLSSTFMKLMYESYGLSYGEKYLCTSPSAQYFVHM